MPRYVQENVLENFKGLFLGFFPSCGIRGVYEHLQLMWLYSAVAALVGRDNSKPTPTTAAPNWVNSPLFLDKSLSLGSVWTSHS